MCWEPGVWFPARDGIARAIGAFILQSPGKFSRSAVAGLPCGFHFDREPIVHSRRKACDVAKSRHDLQSNPQHNAMSDSAATAAPSFERDIFPPDVRAVMENPGEIVVTLHAIESLSIENLLFCEYEWARGHKAYCGYPLLYSISLTPEAAARELRVLLDGVDNSDGSIIMCFYPRHIFSFDAGGIHYDLIVCYDCNAIRLWRDGEHVQTHLTISMNSKGAEAPIVAAGIRRRLDYPGI
ncbi:MAG: hypothetical protein ACAI35_26610 [Candidatus Methylacidiphilales bacterium]